MLALRLIDPLQGETLWLLVTDRGDVQIGELLAEGSLVHLFRPLEGLDQRRIVEVQIVVQHHARLRSVDDQLGRGLLFLIWDGDLLFLIDRILTELVVSLFLIVIFLLVLSNWFLLEKILLLIHFDETLHPLPLFQFVEPLLQLRLLLCKQLSLPDDLVPLLLQL